jgi:hypothetical protein
LFNTLLSVHPTADFANLLSLSLLSFGNHRRILPLLDLFLVILPKLFATKPLSQKPRKKRKLQRRPQRLNECFFGGIARNIPLYPFSFAHLAPLPLLIDRICLSLNSRTQFKIHFRFFRRRRRCRIRETFFGRNIKSLNFIPEFYTT